MTQLNGKLDKMSKSDVNREITLKFLSAIDKIVKENLFEHITSENKVTEMFQKQHNYFSKIKNDPNRYVTLDMIAGIVNELGLNSNVFFVLNEKEEKKEKFFREGQPLNSTRSGNTNNISNSTIEHFVQGAIVNGDNNQGNISTTLKIINGLPAKDQKELKKYFAAITNQNEGLKDEVLDLKKTLAQHEKALKEKNAALKAKENELKTKETDLKEISRKYITLLEGQVSKKK